MRILVISNLCPPDYDGGFELSALRNANSLRDLGHDVELVTGQFRVGFQGERVDPRWVHRIFQIPQVNDGWSNAEMFLGGDSDLGFKIGNFFNQFGLRYENIRSLIKMLNVASANEEVLSAFLENNDFDAAYVFGLHKIGTSVIRSLMRKNIPVLYHQGDEWLAYYLKPGLVKRAVLNLLCPVTYLKERKIDVRNIVLVSNFMKQRFKDAGFHEDQLSVIYRGVELGGRVVLDRERFGPPVFLVASRLTLYKGIHFAIRAASVLNARAPKLEWELWIAGHGDRISMNYFTALVDELNIGHRVKFIGKHSRESTFEHMKRATAVISPSVFDEPFGNTNIEALASGTPLIASRSGAIEEIIEHGKSGLVYDRYNVEELAHHMRLILENKILRRSLQIEGQKRVNQMFTQIEIIKEVESKLMEISGTLANVPRREKTGAFLQ
jgi:glycosyltransferase involved in cell wall biosynthesis